MNNRVDNPGFLSELAKSGLAKVGQNAALLGALTAGFAGQVKADTFEVTDATGATWSCGNNVDDLEGDGVDETAINDVEGGDASDGGIRAMSGIPGVSVVTRSITTEAGILDTQISENSWDFDTIRPTVATYDENALDSSIGMTGYAPYYDESVLRVSGSNIYLASDVSSGSPVLTALGSDFTGSYGSVDNSADWDEIAVRDDIGSSTGADIYNWMTGDLIYSSTGTQSNPVIDREASRLFMFEDSNLELVNNLGTTNDKSTLVENAAPVQYWANYDAPEHAPYDTIAYIDLSDYRAKVCLNLDSGAPEVVDADLDGVSAGTDCDDEDETVGTPETFFIDSDLDGYGSSETTVACPGTPGAVTNALDCDDTDASIQGTVTLFPDSDGDGFGDDSAAETVCPGTPGMTDVPGDCDDTDPSVHPSSNDDCNGVDDDCDGEVDGEVDVTGEGEACDTQITPMGSAEIIDGVVVLDQIGDGVSVVIYDGSTLVVDATPYGTHFPVSARGAGSLVLGTEATLHDVPVVGGAAPTPPPVASEGALMLRISPEQTGILTYTDADGVAHEITYADGVTYVEIPKPTEDTGGGTDGGNTDGGSSDGGTEGDGGSTVQDGGSVSQDGGAEKPIENPIEEPDDKGLLGCSTVEGTNGGMWTLATALLLAARRKRKQ